MPLDEPGNVYLLGLYLGDGCISRDPRTCKLRIVQDASYPHLITLIQRPIGRVHGGSGKVGTVSNVGCVEIYALSIGSGRAGTGNRATSSPTIPKTILRIFREAWDAADIDCRMSKPDTISIARHAAVAKLDAFIGPKA